MKRIAADLFSVIVMGIGIIALSLACLLFWFLGQSNSSKPQALLQRLKSLHHLEVLQAQLVGTQVFREGSRIPFGNHEVVVLARGRAVYGVDLSQATMSLSGRQMRVELPRIEVLHVILNPDTIDFAAPRKAWLASQEEFEIFRQRAASQMQTDLNQQARSAELMAEAEKQAQMWLRSWLATLGQRDAQISFKYSQQKGTASATETSAIEVPVETP
ncbi:MAG: DUF4230 domain-containing protein [Candidatus Sericytochromatia bacterium]